MKTFSPSELDASEGRAGHACRLHSRPLLGGGLRNAQRVCGSGDVTASPARGGGGGGGRGGSGGETDADAETQAKLLRDTECWRLRGRGAAEREARGNNDDGCAQPRRRPRSGREKTPYGCPRARGRREVVSLRGGRHGGQRGGAGSCARHR